MSDNPLADHAGGLELQIVELVEKKERATVQGRTDEVDRLQRELDAKYAELAATAEKIADQS